MSLIAKLTPINLLEEKAKFVADHSYNPQFIYENKVEEKTLIQYGLPRKGYVELAQRIVDKAYFHRNEQDLLMMKGKVMTQEEVTKKIKFFLNMHGLEERFEVVWSSSFISRTAINADAIKLKLPVRFRKEDLLGMLYHEIGTHAIRRVNYEQQSWFRRKKKYGFASYLKTEEGLAILHSLIPHTYKLAYIPAIRYLATDFSQSHSFSETFKFLSKYIEDFERCWTATFRQKRGLEDTSQSGGFTKDLVYFAGLIEVWQYLKEHDFDITKLYFGKMAASDVGKSMEMNPEFEPLLPSFFTIDQDEYKKELEAIGKENMLGEI